MHPFCYLVKLSHRFRELLAAGVAVGPDKMKGFKMNLFNKAVNMAKTGFNKAVAFVKDTGAKALGLGTVVGVAAASVARASTDATTIATDAQTAFGVIAPITITIAGFYVILKIAKRVVH